MLSLDGRNRSLFARRERSRRRPLAGVDLLLWGIPLAMIALAGILIASTQRQADYADWYQHWITAAAGLGIGLLLARVP
ncbi:MAG: rod shape-determining protein RodA, partial [Prochlorococcaceae cyanobacterium]